MKKKKDLVFQKEFKSFITYCGFVLSVPTRLFVKICLEINHFQLKKPLIVPQLPGNKRKVSVSHL